MASPFEYIWGGKHSTGPQGHNLRSNQLSYTTTTGAGRNRTAALGLEVDAHP